MSQNPPFVRNAFVAKPSIVGARWWQESVQAPVGRRPVLVAALLGGVAIVGAGTIFALASGPSAPEVQTVNKSALDMQREYGWNFGAASDALTLDTPSPRPVDAAVLANLPDRMKPTQARHQPYYVSTLFQAPSALPRSVPAEDAQPVNPLAQAIRPIMTSGMRTAFQQGRAFAALLDTAGKDKDTAVIVDLPGPEAVAFAAGAASRFEPVFLFDNWPHPKGVVASHLTLAAAVALTKPFDQGAATRPAQAPAMFVLDRNRLAAYSDEANQFDNRYVAKVPDAVRLKAIGYRNVVYVAPSDTAPELDDLNEDFVAYQQASIPVRVVAAPAFAGDPAAKPRSVAEDDRDYDDGSTYAYGGSTRSGATFGNVGRTYVPSPRRTSFSSGASTTTSSGARPRPAGFGTTAVVVAAATGVILGSRLSRSGSWNRSGGSSAFG